MSEAKKPGDSATSVSILSHQFMEELTTKNPGEVEFHQAVREVVQSVMPVIQATPAYQEAGILDRLVEPERVIMFRVPWID
ncbi:MAG: hypothetical protein U9N87_07660, partial [Planctomycetota bacterium]|nr:hypothetical protein [Planctomycetota bacterium]